MEGRREKNDVKPLQGEGWGPTRRGTDHRTFAASAFSAVGSVVGFRHELATGTGRAVASLARCGALSCEPKTWKTQVSGRGGVTIKLNSTERVFSLCNKVTVN